MPHPCWIILSSDSSYWDYTRIWGVDLSCIIFPSCLTPFFALQNLFLYGYGAIFNFLAILGTTIVTGMERKLNWTMYSISVGLKLFSKVYVILVQSCFHTIYYCFSQCMFVAAFSFTQLCICIIGLRKLQLFVREAWPCRIFFPRIILLLELPSCFLSISFCFYFLSFPVWQQ